MREPVAISQMHMVQSLDPDAMRLPSGEKARDHTARSCPLKIFRTPSAFLLFEVKEGNITSGSLAAGGIKVVGIVTGVTTTGNISECVGVSSNGAACP